MTYIGPKIWNSLSSDLKSANNVNSFKHKIKDNFSKMHRERKKTFMCSTKTTHPLSHSCLGLTIIMLYPKAHSNIMFIYRVSQKKRVAFGEL